MCSYSHLFIAERIRRKELYFAMKQFAAPAFPVHLSRSNLLFLLEKDLSSGSFDGDKIEIGTRRPQFVSEGEALFRIAYQKARLSVLEAP